ncbi:hypothetical protein [Gordonia hankookensis]|uniref:DUF222 domain-containing protein n=1 Tax=Gordonia hankookensis TaxID=589403 RepID=A0ABR7WFW2_9ACTN|nr:hypothetical protein [Gordonia hankookensis]MBD1321670.1 hypothetical protein [Gordonia hankookensis]
MTTGPTPMSVPPEIRALAEQLAPGTWPSADVRGLRAAAARCRDLASRAADLAVEVVAAHRDHVIGAGAFHDGVVEGGRALTGSPDTGFGRLIGRLESTAKTLDSYADAAATTHNEMAVIASLADRERLRSDLLATLGDDSARVVTAGGGRMALTAAGEDYTDAAGGAGHRHHDDQAQPAATSGMLPFSAMSGLAAGAGALAASHAGTVSPDPAELSGPDTNWLQRRAAQLQSGLPSSVAGWVRMAVGIGVSADGSRAVVIGTSDPYPYLREGITLSAGEIIAGNGRAAELAVVDHMTASGISLQAIASATPMAPGTLAALAGTDAELFAPDEHGSHDGLPSLSHEPGSDHP